MNVSMLAYELFPFNLGGLGIHIKYIADSLSRLCDLEVVMPFDMNASGIKVVPVPVNGAKSLVKVKYDPEMVRHYNKVLVKRFEGNNTDVVHSHDWVTADGGRRVKEEFGIPFVLTLHSTMLGKKKYLGTFKESRYGLEKSLYSADRIIAVSGKIKEELVDLYSVDPKIIRVVYNGIDSGGFSTGDENKYIFFIGRISPMKGIEYLLESFAGIIDDYRDYKLVICGEGDVDYVDEIKERCRKLKIDRKVQFIGRVDQKKLNKLYSESTIVCLPSIYEPFGLTVLEGAASGKPVITTSMSGASEIIDNWKNAVVVKPKDSAELSMAMKKLLDNAELRNNISKNALKLAKQYSWDKAAKETLNVYKEIA